MRPFLRKNLFVSGIVAALMLPSFAMCQALLPGVHAAFRMTSLRPPGFNPRVGGMDFLPNGDLVISTWDGFGTTTSFPGRIFILKNVQTGDSTQVTGTATPFASNMNEPLGVKVVDGEIYVMTKDSLVQLLDANKDQILDSRKKIVGGWTRNIGDNTNKDLQFMHGLVYTPAPDNRMIMGMATRWNNGGPAASTGTNANHDGCIIGAALYKTTYDVIACGIRSPDGIVLGPEDGIFVTDNQGNYVPASKLLHIKQGRFFNVYHSPASPFESTTVTRPVIWMPHGTTVDKIGVSPTQPVYLKTGVFKGQMLNGDNNLGTLQRYFLEKVNGEYQGAIFRFSGGLQAAAHRIITGPDGALYIGGMGATSAEWGGWAWNSQQYGLQRMTEIPNTAFFDMLAVRSTGPTSFEIEFTEPTTPFAQNAITVQEWSVTPQQAYGTRINSDTRTLSVQSIILSADGKKAALEIPGLKKSSNDSSFIVYIKLSPTLQSTTGHTLWSSQAWYTLNNFGPGIDVVSIESRAARTNPARWNSRAMALPGGHLQATWGMAPVERVEVVGLDGRILESSSGITGEKWISKAAYGKGLYIIRLHSSGAAISHKVVF